MFTPASRERPTGHVFFVDEQMVWSAVMFDVERNEARWMSPVSRFNASVSASWAEETRASRWKKVVAFFDRAKAAAATSTPALSATRISMTVKPRLRAMREVRWCARMTISDRRVVLGHGRDDGDEAVSARERVGGQ